MIGKLQGTVDYIGDDHIILMVGGVGYKVFTIQDTGNTKHETVSLWIETVVREDSIRLFGFASRAGLELFNSLTGVSGVGPRVAMAILGTLSPDVLMSAIATGDAKTIATAPGVGKKVAEKIILELKGKSVSVSDSVSGVVLTDLLSALESLGYRRADVAERAQKLVRDNPTADVGALVRCALKEIVK